MVLNYYDNPGVSNVTNYLNIRQGAGKDEKVIGKLPSYAGCEILEDTGNGWYKIRSGNITGYVSSEFILTGDAARQAAMEHAELMAIVSTDRLNARTEPSTDAKIWTQISNNERYHVAEQLDGWVKIEFDEGGEGDGADEVSAAYVSTDYVDVRYALAEAIKFSPAEEELPPSEARSITTPCSFWEIPTSGAGQASPGSRLLRLYHVSDEAFRHFPAPLFRGPGQAGHPDQIQPDEARRPDLLWQQPWKDQPRGHVYRQRPDHPCGQQKEWDQDLFLELPVAFKDRGRHRRLILNA